MKHLTTIAEAQKELEGCELVEAKAAPEGCLQVKVVGYEPGARSGKFHTYKDFSMPLAIFKLWRNHVDNLG